MWKYVNNMYRYVYDMWKYVNHIRKYVNYMRTMCEQYAKMYENIKNMNMWKYDHCVKICEQCENNLWTLCERINIYEIQWNMCKKYVNYLWTSENIWTICNNMWTICENMWTICENMWTICEPCVNNMWKYIKNMWEMNMWKIWPMCENMWTMWEQYVDSMWKIWTFMKYCEICVKLCEKSMNHMWQYVNNM